MHKIEIKKLFLPSLMITMIIGLFSLMAIVSSTIYSSVIGDNYSYVLRGLVDNVVPVNTEVQKIFSQPFTDENVKVSISYYDTNSESQVQEKSLIVYERTYMPNSGILYSSEKKFDVTSAYEGKVISIKKDELLGNIVEIQHDNDIITRYSSLSEVKVNKDDNVNIGEVIGTSGVNKISSESQNMLLFEIVIKGYNVNPDNYYDKSIEDLQ